MIINVHAGHAPDGGKGASGAVGLIKESTEARKVKDELIKYLVEEGHTVYDCTCDYGYSQNDVLSYIVKKCNAHKVDIDVSIHFNSGASDQKGNGKTTGAEALVLSIGGSKEKINISNRFLEAMEKKGFKNRGIKERTNLYFLNKTNAPAILFEIVFVDDADDVKLYEKIGAKGVAKILAEAITNTVITEKIAEREPIKVGDTVKANVNLKIRTTSTDKFDVIGLLYSEGTAKILQVNDKGARGRIAKGMWINISGNNVTVL